MASRKGLCALAVKSSDGQDNTLRVLSPIAADFAQALTRRLTCVCPANAGAAASPLIGVALVNGPYSY